MYMVLGQFVREAVEAMNTLPCSTLQREIEGHNALLSQVNATQCKVLECMSKKTLRPASAVSAICHTTCRLLYAASFRKPGCGNEHTGEHD